jgi:hypothetical protein
MSKLLLHLNYATSSFIIGNSGDRYTVALPHQGDSTKEERRFSPSKHVNIYVNISVLKSYD